MRLKLLTASLEPRLLLPRVKTFNVLKGLALFYYKKKALMILWLASWQGRTRECNMSRTVGAKIARLQDN